MGTTESLLYDDQPPNESSVPQPQRPGTTSPSGRRPRSLDSPSKGGGGDSVLAAAGASKKPNRPITRISGVLVGGPKVGKGTLLQILSGKDPFAHEAANEQVPITVAIPYAPPAGLPTWNRIKLQVGRVKNGEALPKVDFMVVLIRPTSEHTLEDIQSHTLQAVRSYLSHLEYSPNEHVEKEKNDTTSTTIRTPVCICVMINFRDLLQDDEETNSHVQQLEHELESFLKNVLRHYTIPNDRLLLQFMSTSLLNGYGLNRLHNFIYRTYLQKKQEALEAQLRAVTVQIQNTGEPDFVSYTDFVKLVAPLESDNNQALSRKAAQPPRSSSHQRDSGQNQQSSTRVAGAPSRPHPEQQPQPQPDAASVDKPSRKGRTSAEQAPNNGKNKGPESSRGGAGKGGRRQLYPQTNQPARVGRDALEAFLADSSDEEPPKQKKNSKKNQQTKKNQKDKTPFRHPVDSSDDDDDDFFYDESGRFKNSKAIVRDDEASSSSESSSSSSEDGKRSGAISRPSSPSTTVAKSVPQPKEAVLEQAAKKLPVVPPRRDLKQQQQQRQQKQEQQQQQIGAELKSKSEKTTVSSTRISRTPPAPEPEKEQVRMTSDKSDDVSDDDDDLTVEREIGASADDNSDESSRDESQEYAKSAGCLPSPVAPTRVYKDTSSTASDTRPAQIEVSEGIAGPSNTQSLSRALSNEKDSDSSDCDAHMNEKEVRPEKNERGVVKADSNPMEKRRVHRYDSSSDEDDTSRGQANATAPIAADEDSDDEEFFISEETKQVKASPHGLGTCTDDDSDSNDDDDEDFFINQDDQKQQDDQEDSGPEPEVAPHSEDNDRLNHQSVVEASERASNPTRSSSTPSQLASSPRPDPKEAPKDASPPTSSLVGAAIRRTSSNADDDSDDDDDDGDFILTGDDRNGQEVEGTKPLSPTTATVERNDSPRPSSPPMARSPPSVEHQRTTLSASSSMTTSGELTSTTTTSAAPISSGISAAALAAIQAAQKEAEAMLLQSDEDDVVGNGGGGSGMRKPKKSKKEKKSKKDGSEKKKKKDKSKRDRVVDDSSDG